MRRQDRSKKRLLVIPIRASAAGISPKEKRVIARPLAGARGLARSVAHR